MDKLIDRVYTDPANPGAFGGTDALYRAMQAKHPEISKKQVQKYLEANRTYTLFKPRRLRFRRLRTVPFGFLSGKLIHSVHK